MPHLTFLLSRPLAISLSLNSKLGQEESLDGKGDDFEEMRIAGLKAQE